MRISSSSRFALMFALGAFLPATTMFGSTILGEFDFVGTATVVDSSSIMWTLPPGPVDKALVQVTNGIYPAGAVGTDISIVDITNPPDVVGGSGFPSSLFISFDGFPAVPNLLLNFISPGVFTATDCFLAPAVGQTCTPSPNSPFSFVNKPGGNSTVSFDFSGVDTAGHPWTGEFSSNFNVPFQTVLALASRGPVTNTYAATIVTSTSPVPEPNTWLLGLGAFGVMIGCWRKKSKTSAS